MGNITCNCVKNDKNDFEGNYTFDKATVDFHIDYCNENNNFCTECNFNCFYNWVYRSLP